MSHRRQPERRTFLQDRFEILIKKQQKGEANFNELTELDAIVNADPEIRKRIIIENMLMEYPEDFNKSSNIPEIDKNIKAAHPNLLNRIKSLIGRTFNLKIYGLQDASILRSAKFRILC